MRQRVGNKWIQLGKATPTKAVPVTFKSNGIKKLRVKSGKKSKIVKVGVYGRFNMAGAEADTPTLYGDVILPSDMSPYWESASFPATLGCVLVDAGVKVGRWEERSPMSYSFSIASTGANPYNSPVIQAPDGFGVTGIPVAGDVVMTMQDTGGSAQEGAVATCLNTPKWGFTKEKGQLL